MERSTLPAPDVRDLAPDLSEFDPVSLEELENSEARLMSRKEKKFLMTLDQCRGLLSDLKDNYRVLEIGNSKIGRYETVYYDTDTFMMYLQHHNGRAHRYKVRSRFYCSTNKTFLEVKERKNTGRTVKKRLETGAAGPLTEEKPAEFLKNVIPYDITMFHPVLSTIYSRVTLVSKDLVERMTLDLSLSFRNKETGYVLPGIVVGEIKYNGPLSCSRAFSGLKQRGIRKTRFSKYCIGVSFLYSQQKQNRFKQLHMKIDTLAGGRVPSC
jgi:hypothetical protein